ncbi:uncharacterized protein LOC134255638 [Saccostrea cucullata]|uniref:uncharacterized protein LOC134255638 n=1 Tax=Saccostrea cuccullata TaxID=36930 RepID=UPI002ED317C5
MVSLLFHFATLFVLLCFLEAAQDFQEVSDCPKNADAWRIASDKKNCQGDTTDYLCAAIENSVGRFGEICTRYGLQSANTCAVLHSHTHNLQSVPCNVSERCPDKPYNPGELYKWPVCYEDFSGNKRQVKCCG